MGELLVMDELLVKAAAPGTFDYIINQMRSWATILVNAGGGNPQGWNYIFLQIIPPTLTIVAIIITINLAIKLFKKFSR